MKNKLQQIMKGQVGQAGLVVIVGLVLFVAGIACLLVWGANMQNNGEWFFPGLVLTGGGVILLFFSLRGGGG